VCVCVACVCVCVCIVCVYVCVCMCVCCVCMCVVCVCLINCYTNQLQEQLPPSIEYTDVATLHIGLQDQQQFSPDKSLADHFATYFTRQVAIQAIVKNSIGEKIDTEQYGHTQMTELESIYEELSLIFSVGYSGYPHIAATVLLNNSSAMEGLNGVVLADTLNQKQGEMGRFELESLAQAIIHRNYGITIDQIAKKVQEDVEAGIKIQSMNHKYPELNYLE